MKKKSREEKVEALVTGSDGHVRGAAVQVKTKAGRLRGYREISTKAPSSFREFEQSDLI